MQTDQAVRSNELSSRLRFARLARQLFLLALVIAFAVIAVIVVGAVRTTGSTQTSRATDAALSYAHQQMVWTAGPRVKASRIVRLRQLDQALKTSARPSLRQDVNVPDLIHQYGAGTRMALVVLSGSYNTLPPDEGVSVNAEVIVLVNPRTDRVALLTA